MRISDQPPIDLTYCLNVHPGETWNQQLDALCENTLVIRDFVTASRPTRRFGLGLRLSALSAQQLRDPATLEAFKKFLAEEDLYVFTVNGFSYGQFHQTIVKDRVYKPDWTQPARRKYTETIARVLVELLDDGAMVGVSTAPLTFKGRPDWQRSIPPGLRQLIETAYTLWQLHRQTGRRVILALEPEPYCYPETTCEVLEIFDLLRHDLGPKVLKRYGVPRSDVAGILQDHLGICFDTAHQAVQFEDLTVSLQSLLDAQVPIAKVQLSAALEVDPTVVSPEVLSRFADRTYLHQTYVQMPEGSIRRYADLPDLPELTELAITSPIRIHYHWPLYQSAVQHGITSTSHLLAGDFANLLRTNGCPHWEIETYTWNMLPTACPLDLRLGIAQEFVWVSENLFN